VIFARVYPSLRRFANVVRDRDIDPDDLVQEATARTLRIGPLCELEDPESYLRIAILRIASNERRRRSRERTAIGRLPLDPTHVDTYPSDLEQLRRLSSRDRAAIYLAVVLGLSFRDVGETLGCREATARPHEPRTASSSA
jgi:DNA-directed RNA polymerase specialized sigma24 family protein